MFLVTEISGVSGVSVCLHPFLRCCSDEYALPPAYASIAKESGGEGVFCFMSSKREGGVKAPQRQRMG